jgi:hypothetical protein
MAFFKSLRLFLQGKLKMQKRLDRLVLRNKELHPIVFVSFPTDEELEAYMHGIRELSEEYFDNREEIAGLQWKLRTPGEKSQQRSQQRLSKHKRGGVFTGGDRYRPSAQKIRFYTHPFAGKELEATDRHYILLMYYLSERNDIPELTSTISELEAVHSGARTFKEVFTDVYGTITISWGAGEFECDKNAAYFISNDPDSEPSLEMPLEELIGLMKEWKVFLS